MVGRRWEERGEQCTVIYLAVLPNYRFLSSLLVQISFFSLLPLTFFFLFSFSFFLPDLFLQPTAVLPCECLSVGTNVNGVLLCVLETTTAYDLIVESE